MLDFQIHNLRLCLYSLTIHASSEPALAAYLDKAVSAIEFGSSTVYQGFQLCIHIKLDFWEYWMVDCMIDDTRAGEEHEDELSAWMSDLSLDINLRRFISFRLSESYDSESDASPRNRIYSARYRLRLQHLAMANYTARRD
jgi:hypothetical protein